MRKLLTDLEHKKTLRYVTDEIRKTGIDESSETLERLYNYFVNLLPSIFCIQVNFRGDVFTGPYGYAASFDGSLPYQNEIFNGKQLFRCITLYEVKENNALRSDLKSKAEAQINCRKVIPLTSRHVPRLASGEIKDWGCSGWHESLSEFNSRIMLCESEEQLPNDITKLKRMWIVVENTLPEETLNELSLYGYFLKSSGYDDDIGDDEGDNEEEGARTVVTYKRIFKKIFGIYQRARRCAIENNNRLAVIFAEALGVNFKDPFSLTQRFTQSIINNNESSAAIDNLISVNGNENIILPEVYDSAENDDSVQSYYTDDGKYYQDRGHSTIEEFLEKERSLFMDALEYWPSKVVITPVSSIPDIYTDKKKEEYHQSTLRCIPKKTSLLGWRIGYYCYYLYNYKNINSAHKKITSDTIKEFEDRGFIYSQNPRTIKPAITSIINDIKWDDEREEMIYYDSCVCTYTPGVRIKQSSSIKVEGICVPLHCKEGYTVINSSIFERDEKYNAMCSTDWTNDYLNSYPTHYKIKEIPSSGDHLSIETETQDIFFSQSLFGISINKEGDTFIPATQTFIQKEHVPKQLRYTFDEGLYDTFHKSYLKKQLNPLNVPEIARKNLKPIIGYIPD